MIELALSEAWKTSYPGAAIGLLAMDRVTNPAHHSALDKRKADLEQSLRLRFAGYDRAHLKAHPVLQAYSAYYRSFKKTYHVRLQLESVVFKGKPIPRVAALVEAMFMAELEHLLLTAGHDLGTVHMPITIDVSDGSERFIRMNGQEQVLKPRDMIITDAQGILSSIIYGPDRRTRISPNTRQVLFTAYAPVGIEERTVYQNLEDIRDNILLFAPQAEVLQLRVYSAK